MHPLEHKRLIENMERKRTSSGTGEAGEAAGTVTARRIVLVNKSGDPVLSLSGGGRPGEGGTITIARPDGSPAVVIGDVDGGGVVCLSNGDGRVKVSLDCGDGDGHCRVIDGEGGEVSIGK